MSVISNAAKPVLNRSGNDLPEPRAPRLRGRAMRNAPIVASPYLRLAAKPHHSQSVASTVNGRMNGRLVNMPKDLLAKFFRFLFFDEVRLLEVFSALNLLAWAEVLLTAPELLRDGAYRGFSNVEAVVWAYCFGAIALGQIVAMIIRRWHPLEFRFAAMAFAAGAWTVIAWNFWETGISTTANLNYTLLAGACAISGAFLAWKSTSYQS